MAMNINTCSQVVSLARELEQKASGFYKELARRWPQKEDFFLGLAGENENYVTLVERAYYGVISDAYEGCFAFDMNPEEYFITTELPQEVDFSQAIRAALALEEKLIGFYKEAARQSKSLMADVPRAMELVARKRSERLGRLTSLMEKG
jgi:rubrerythrin